MFFNPYLNAGPHRPGADVGTSVGGGGLVGNCRINAAAGGRGRRSQQSPLQQQTTPRRRGRPGKFDGGGSGSSGQDQSSDGGNSSSSEGACFPLPTSKRSGVQKQFMQIVPRGVMFDGQTGLIKHKTGRVPIMFYREIKHLLTPDLIWPCPLRETLVGRVVGPIRFHTYDQVDGVLFFDSPENVSPRYRGHLVPSGNVLRFFGATEHGYSICVNVFGQRTYFYCEYGDTERLREVIASVGELVPEPRTPYAMSVTPATKTSIYGYGTRPVPDLQCVSISNWSMARKIGEYLLERGFPVYEARVDPLTRLVIDRRITTFGWCSVNRYDWRHQGRSSTCDIEVDCDVSDLVAVPDDNSWPLYRCLSFDIECMSADGGFPCAEKPDDIVIQISCVCYETGGGSADGAGGVGVNGGATPAPTQSHHGNGESGGIPYYPQAATAGVGAQPPVFGRSGLHLFTIGTCDPVGEADVYEFPSEYELLLGFMLFFQRYAPSFMTGYNINSFDLKYILTRLEYLYKLDVQRFCKVPVAQGGRFFLHSPTLYRRHQDRASFAAAAANAPTKVYISGCVVVDMYPVCMAKTNSPNYKLNTMAELYLGQRKDDLSYKEIPVKFVANAQGRAQVGRYCLQDALLVRDLFNTINFHYEAGAIARLAKIPMRRVIFDGQQIRIYTSLLDECACRDYILPNHYQTPPTEAAVANNAATAVFASVPPGLLSPDGSSNTSILSAGAVTGAPGDVGSATAVFNALTPVSSEETTSSCDGVSTVSGASGTSGGCSGSSGGGSVTGTNGGILSAVAPSSAAAAYQGATVFEPVVGYYNDPVAVFDFASLYPSIIMAHNLCYSTLLVPGGEYPVDPADVYSVTLENGITHRFVRASVRVSVLSELLNKWVSQRKAVRECMRECRDPMRRMLLDKEQMALKVTCNAFYGFTGVVNGMMPCLPIAASITRIGRDMLERTARFIEDNFSEPCFLRNFFNQEDYAVASEDEDAREEEEEEGDVVHGDLEMIVEEEGGGGGGENGVGGRTHSLVFTAAAGATATRTRRRLHRHIPYKRPRVGEEAERRGGGGSGGWTVEARVIYGDTDSVFVHYRGLTAQALVSRGPALADYVTACLFNEPVKLEFEKVFVSLMMICKKRYIGKVEGAAGLSMKGVDLVRKTACEFVKGVTRDVLSLLFDDREVSQAAVRLSRLTLEDVRAQGVPAGFWPILWRLTQARDDLYLRRVRVEDLVLSSVLSKDISLYRQSNLPHIAVIKRLAARSEELPSVGDRVFYVLTAPGEGRSSSGVCNYEVAEDPTYVREHNVPIHADKYFDQVLKAVTNVLSPIFPEGEIGRKDRFLSMVLPRRLHLEAAFLPYSVKEHECC
ncbi:DNA polymerase catalytic subunit [Panine betaherpesvirus 2]|uniref:DNA polymerase n=2 Tax=Herpesvirales TaxID=548681 RepID=Q8QS34_9BETA|nr:DNA polymerase catalytic subunit [Panine betaherpesvirus 2]AAM00704.1 DNA polymerase catalytic subunit [Panine betaherpesvirus 2]